MELFSPFESLPNEVLYHLFSVFDANLLGHAARVCSHWRATASGNSLWASLFQERFVLPLNITNTEEPDWKSLYVTCLQRLQRYERAIEIGSCELKRVLDKDMTADPLWLKAPSTIASVLPGMEIWRRDFPTEKDPEWPKEFATWEELEGALLEEDGIDPIDSPLRARMRVAMRASRVVDLKFDQVVELLLSPQLRKLWDIILEDGFRLVDLDQKTDIVMLIYANVDCCLVRRFENTMRPGGERVFTLSEQSVPYSTELKLHSTAALGRDDEYQSDPDFLAAVWGSGFRAEELSPGGPCRVYYVVQIVPDPTQIVFSNDMIREMQMHRGHCLSLLEAASRHHKSLGTRKFTPGYH